jgi:hypothetical protein
LDTLEYAVCTKNIKNGRKGGRGMDYSSMFVLAKGP